MDTRAPRRRLRPEQRRLELLDALAIELAASHWHGLTVPMVVRRASTSQGLFYRYFSDLDAAFIALLEDRIVPPLVAMGEELTLDHSEGRQVEDSLTGWFEGLAELVEQQGPILRAALRAAPSSQGRAAQYCQGLLDQLQSWGEALLEPLSGTDPYRLVDVHHVSHMVVGMTVHCALVGLDGTEPKAWAREMARFETWGLAGEPPQRRRSTEPDRRR